MEPHTAKRVQDEAARRAWGGYVRARMAERGWSVARLAAEVTRHHPAGATVTKSTAQNWCEGAAVTDPDLVFALADALDVGARALVDAMKGRTS